MTQREKWKLARKEAANKKRPVIYHNRVAKSPRVYKNTPEQMLAELMRSQGYEVSKRGWPDFICFKGDEVICIEVKPNANHPLKREQKRVMEILEQHGFSVRRWDPEQGFAYLDDDVIGEV